MLPPTPSFSVVLRRSPPPTCPVSSRPAPPRIMCTLTGRAARRDSHNASAGGRRGGADCWKLCRGCRTGDCEICACSCGRAQWPVYRPAYRPVYWAVYWAVYRTVY
eukprot:162690-Chlamydomonas_euryale.AAC.1